MAKQRRHFYMVEGNGRFPYDMLRYDQSWPVSEAKDSPGLAADWDGEKRRVLLATDTHHGPNRDRWKSHGWRVIMAAVNDQYAVEEWRDLSRTPGFL